MRHHRFLLLVFLVTLILIFLSVLVKDRRPLLLQSLDFLYLLFGTLGLLYSFLLWWPLAAFQDEALDLRLEDLRREEKKADEKEVE